MNTAAVTVLCIWLGIYLGRKAAEVDLGGRIGCWLGLHWWCYPDVRHRRCLRPHCQRAEEDLGYCGDEERWVKHE